MKINKEIKAVLIVLLGTIIFIFGIKFLKSGAFFEFNNYYYAIYSNVEGLIETAPITLNGYKIGNVRHIDFMPNGKLIVAFTINHRGLHIPKNSKANLKDNSIMGTKAIQIIPSIGNESLFLKKGDTLQGTISEGLKEMIGQKLDPVVTKASHVIQTIDSTFTRLNNILDENGQKQITQSIKNFRASSTSLRKSAKLFQNMLVGNKENINKTLENIQSATQNIKIISHLLRKARANEMVKNMNQVLRKIDTIVENLNQGKGSLGKMINDNDLYINLNKTSKEAEALLQDIKLHPKRYFSILRRKEIPYTPPQ